MEPLEHATNAELLTKLTGKPDTADALLRRYGGLTDLAKASFDELQLVTGVGQSKAAAIKAAFLLAQRLTQETYPEAPLLDSPDRVADLLRESNRLYTVENMQVVLVNTRRRLIAIENVSQGTLDTVVTHAREVFYPAVSRRASAIILAHNHPSGDPSPSESDIRITRELIAAGRTLKIEVLDHVIMGIRTADRPRDFVSLRELGFFH